MYKQVKQITDKHVYYKPESEYERGFNEGVEVAMSALQSNEHPWISIDKQVPKQEIDEFTNKILPSEYCFTYDAATRTFGVSRYWNNMFVDIVGWDAHSPTHWKYADIEPPEENK